MPHLEIDKRIDRTSFYVSEEERKAKLKAIVQSGMWHDWISEYDTALGLINDEWNERLRELSKRLSNMEGDIWGIALTPLSREDDIAVATIVHRDSRGLNMFATAPIEGFLVSGLWWLGSPLMEEKGSGYMAWHVCTGIRSILITAYGRSYDNLRKLRERGYEIDAMEDGEEKTKIESEWYDDMETAEHICKDVEIMVPRMDSCQREARALREREESR